MTLTQIEKNILKDIAKNSVQHGLEYQQPLPVDVDKLTLALKEIRATFVTLKIDEKLRGCIGTLTARTTLAQDVSDHAFAAAFRDRRFAVIKKQELPHLQYHISILSPAEPLSFTSEKHLLGQIRPGQDGLILKFGNRHATFLPSVWESLPDAKEFLDNLKLKAGLAKDFWSDQIKISRYQCEEF